MPVIDVFGEQVMRHEAPNIHTCPACRTKLGTVRCRNCPLSAMRCRDCIKVTHLDNPLHSIEVITPL